MAQCNLWRSWVCETVPSYKCRQSGLLLRVRRTYIWGLSLCCFHLSTLRKLICNFWHGSNWIRDCMEIWDSIPNCQFWNSQWTAVMARVVKNYKFINWECFLTILFTKFLNMFEVSVFQVSLILHIQIVEVA